MRCRFLQVPEKVRSLILPHFSEFFGVIAFVEKTARVAENFRLDQAHAGQPGLDFLHELNKEEKNGEEFLIVSGAGCSAVAV